MKRQFIFLFVIIGCVSFTVEEDFISTIKQKADQYFAKTNRAKLVLFFNQPKYIPGDTAFFKTVYLRANNSKPVTGIELVHICLFDQLGKKRLTRTFSIANGEGNHALVIPDNLPAGHYKLVGFTDWMKNLSQSLFYQQEFVVAGKNLFSKAVLRDTIEFYPEGGHLVAGVENNIAIRYTGRENKIKAVIKASGQEVATLSLVKDSVTVWRVSPLNVQYDVEISGMPSKKFILPTPINSGVTLIADASDNRIKLQLQRTDQLADPHLYLLVFNNSGLIFQNDVNFGTEKKMDVTFPQNLAQGVAQVVITDAKYNLWAKRTVFLGLKPAPVIQSSNPTGAFSSRQAGALNLQVKDKEGFGVNGTFAYRIINNDLFTSSTVSNDYLILGADVSNSFELKKEHRSAVAINNYLITQTCPWLDWEKMMSKELQLSFKPEHYLNMSGKAVYARNGLPVRDSTMLMFYLEKNLSGYETYAHNKGHFIFPLVLNVNSNDQFFYTATFKGNDEEEIRVKIEDPDSLISFRAEPTIASELNDPYFIYRTQSNTIIKSYSFFANRKTLSDSTTNPNRAMEEELNDADVTVQLSDYLQMPTMEEVLKEIVRSVDYRKVNGRHVVRVYTTAKKPTNHTGPLYVIDGQLTKSPEHFINLKPAEVSTIKVVKDSRKLFALGKLGANGVVLIRTKKGVKINEPSMLDFAGLLPVSRESVRNQNPQTPDLRSCLYWSPNNRVSGATEIKFTTSDDIGNFRLQIFGITESGTPFSFEQPLEVKYSGN